MKAYMLSLCGNNSYGAKGDTLGHIVCNFGRRIIEFYICIFDCKKNLPMRDIGQQFAINESNVFLFSLFLVFVKFSK